MCMLISLGVTALEIHNHERHIADDNVAEPYLTGYRIPALMPPNSGSRDISVNGDKIEFSGKRV